MKRIIGISSIIGALALVLCASALGRPALSATKARAAVEHKLAENLATMNAGYTELEEEGALDPAGFRMLGYEVEACDREGTYHALCDYVVTQTTEVCEGTMTVYVDHRGRYFTRWPEEEACEGA